MQIQGYFANKTCNTKNSKRKKLNKILLFLGSCKSNKSDGTKMRFPFMSFVNEEILIITQCFVLSTLFSHLECWISFGADLAFHKSISREIPSGVKASGERVSFLREF